MNNEKTGIGNRERSWRVKEEVEDIVWERIHLKEGVSERQGGRGEKLLPVLTKPWNKKRGREGR